MREIYTDLTRHRSPSQRVNLTPRRVSQTHIQEQSILLALFINAGGSLHWIVKTADSFVIAKAKLGEENCHHPQIRMHWALNLSTSAGLNLNGVW